jgi:hypothetical protein
VAGVPQPAHRRLCPEIADIDRSINQTQYRKVPVEVTDRTLSEEERLRVSIHRQRKEWDAREKEMVAYRLVDFMGRASTASILGITLRELDKLVEVFQLSGRFTNLRDRGAAITWARELMGVSKKLLTPSIIDAVVDKVNRKRVTNSKDLRKLRTILTDPVARDNFMSAEGDLETAMLRVAPEAKKADPVFIANLNTTVESMRQIPWGMLEGLKGDPEVIKKIEDAEALLQSLRHVPEGEQVMKEETRRAIARAVAARVSGRNGGTIYSHVAGRHTHMSGSGNSAYDHEAGAHISGSGSACTTMVLGAISPLMCAATRSPATITARATTAAGTVNGRSVQLYDHGEGRHFITKPERPTSL